MVAPIDFESLFRVANAQSIASYWYNGRLQVQPIAVSRTVNRME
jgi:hypothetical protein